MSGYLMKPIRDKEDNIGAVRNVNNGQKSQNGKQRVLKLDGSLDAFFFKVMREI